jgi:predicted  nucleic acid-binding Zn-ribbon protein
MQEVLENRITLKQLQSLINDLQHEVERVEIAKKSATQRVQYYNDITNRVTFLKNKPAKIERDLRRLYKANQHLDNCIEALNRLQAQLDQYNQQLLSAT